MTWLPWVHIIIGTLKKFLNGTYHGVSGQYLQNILMNSAIVLTVGFGNLNFHIDYLMPA
jgi:hypothetical protein